MSTNTTNNSNMSNNGVVHNETSSNSNTNTSISSSTNTSTNTSTNISTNTSTNISTNANNNWRRHQRIRPEVTIEFPSFYHFLTFNMSLGHNGFRTRPGVDKYRFTKNQVWFPNNIQDKISLGKELAQAMRTIPAINQRFYVRGIFNNANTPENMSDMDMFEIQVMDLIPRPNTTSSII